MYERKHIGPPGFTLAELLVSVAIIVILAGIIFASFGPAREKARETRCISNLHQIGKAIQLYQQDYDGVEPTGAATGPQLGLPTSPWALESAKHLSNWDVWKCSSEYFQEANPRGPKSPSYILMFMARENTDPPVPPFSKRVALRGNDTPLVADPHHGIGYRTNVPTSRSTRILVLRMSGQVQRRMVSRSLPSWEW